MAWRRIVNWKECAPLVCLECQCRVEWDERSGCWPVLLLAGMRVVAAALQHRLPCWGFLLTEAESPGKLDAARLADCGVRPGPHYAQLKAGKTVELSDGRLLEPATFLGPPVPGRRLAVLGDTRDSGELAALVGEAGLDLLGMISRTIIGT